MEIFLGIVCAVLAGLCILVLVKNSQQKEALDAKNEELAQASSRLKKADSMYRETVQAKDNLSTIYDELKERYERSNRIAYTDSLTGLPNAQQYGEMLDSIMLTLRNEENVAVTVLDFADFAKMSETLGKSAKEEMILDVTQRLKANVTFDDDYLARIGESEFALITQNFDDFKEFDQKLNRLFHVMTMPYTSGGREFFPEVYGASAMAPKDGKTSQLISMNVELALCDARAKKKNNYCYYENFMAKKAMIRMEMQAEIRRAISENRFTYVLGAQVNLKQNRVDTYEVQPVWNRSNDEKLVFSQFRSLLEESEFSMNVYKQMLTFACEKQKQWESMGYRDLNLAVPCLTRQFLDENFMKLTYEVMQEVGVNPNRLIFLVPYPALQKEPKSTVEMMHKMNKFGLRFTLDSYDAEEVSLKSLLGTPLYAIKIDDAIFRGMEADTEQLLPLLANLAHSVHAKLIVENTEVKEQETFLRKASVDLASGELYNGFMPEEMAVQFLRICGKDERRS